MSQRDAAHNNNNSGEEEEEEDGFHPLERLRESWPPYSESVETAGGIGGEWRGGGGAVAGP